MDPEVSGMSHHPDEGDAVQVGLVVIGRNEGERLRRCLVSIESRSAPVVYVDSGSQDESVEIARSVGLEVVELDPSQAFTAGRARNAGLEYLLREDPGLLLVQFIDADCQLSPGWLSRAQRQFALRGDLAVVCGRRREIFRESTVYNRLCDMEWDRPAGDVDACGGDAMMRVDAFMGVSGFDPNLIAGEEPDLCYRLRQRGWKILRLSDEMTLHDAGITRFGQWWRRTMRSGHAFTENAWRHIRGTERYHLRESLSILFWGLFLPIIAIALALPTEGMSLLLLLAYPLLALRILRHEMREGRPMRDAALYAGFCVLGKFPQAFGQLRFVMGLLLRKRGGLIEYKASHAAEKVRDRTGR
jgi:GT2 family glycosyltransferase